MIWFSRSKLAGCFGSLMVALAAIVFAHEAAVAQSASTPGPQPQVSPATPPAWRRLEIRKDTPAEREAFLKRREALRVDHPPHEVVPLPEQAIRPSAPQLP